MIRLGNVRGVDQENLSFFKGEAHYTEICVYLLNQFDFSFSLIYFGTPYFITKHLEKTLGLGLAGNTS